MAIKLRTEMKRTTKAVARRNQHLIMAVEAMIEQGSMCVGDLIDTFDLSDSSCRKMMLELRDLKLVELSHTRSLPNNRGSDINYYRPVDNALARAKELLPLTHVEKLPPKPKPQDWSKNNPYEAKTRVHIHRDPLDVYLMGTGRAPSLNFKDSQTGV